MTAMSLPADSDDRKRIPMASGLLDYFPAALAEVARVSYIGNEKHNPGEPLHHARGKSMDHADCIVRHLTDRGTMDTVTLPDGRTFEVPHTAYVAWRALALLQEELEARGAPLARGAKVEQPATVAEHPWTPWHGARDDGPGMPEELVEVKLRMGVTGVATIKQWQWRHDPDSPSADIVAWRPARLP